MQANVATNDSMSSGPRRKQPRDAGGESRESEGAGAEAARVEDHVHPLGRRKKEKKTSSRVPVESGDATQASNSATPDDSTAPARARKSIRWGHVELRAEEIVGSVDNQQGTSRWRHQKRRMSSFEDERAMLRMAGPPSKIEMLKKIRKIRRAALKAESLDKQNTAARGGRFAHYHRLIGLAFLSVVIVFFVHHSCDTWIESLTVTVIGFVIAFGFVL